MKIMVQFYNQRLEEFEPFLEKFTLQYLDEWSKKDKVMAKDIDISEPGIRINFSVEVARCIAKVQAIFSEEGAEAEARKEYDKKKDERVCRLYEDMKGE